MNTRPPRDWIQISITALPGLAAVIALIFTYSAVRATDAQVQLSVQGQITDRYNAAITNLGSPSEDVRLGGIYALERIMQDSPRDQPTVVAVLCAFVRDHANKVTARPLAAAPPTDIQAALTVVTTRDTAHDGSTTVVDLKETQLDGANLDGANLDGANLAGTDLDGALLTGANLAHANLVGTSLASANLTHANADGADLDGAILAGANLVGARLTRAYLYDANLVGGFLANANLDGANLDGANLTNASLAGTKGLPAGTNVASPGGITVLPPGISSIYIYQTPSLMSSVAGRLQNGVPVLIQCTAEGEMVTARGGSSTLWDKIGGGYVPDVFVNTGTNQATKPSC